MKYVWRYPVVYMLMVISACSCGLLSDSNHDPNDMAGGPCSYDEYRVPARIIVFDRLDSTSIDVRMLLDSNEWVVPPADTIDFYMEKGRYLTPAEADSLDLGKGKALTYLVQRIKSGSCTPEINTLLLEQIK